MRAVRSSAGPPSCFPVSPPSFPKPRTGAARVEARERGAPFFHSTPPLPGPPLPSPPHLAAGGGGLDTEGWKPSVHRDGNPPAEPDVSAQSAVVPHGSSIPVLAHSNPSIPSKGKASGSIPLPPPRAPHLAPQASRGFSHVTRLCPTRHSPRVNAEVLVRAAPSRFPSQHHPSDSGSPILRPPPLPPAL